MDAPIEKIFGEADGSTEGELFIDPEDITRSTGLLKIDLEKLARVILADPPDAATYVAAGPTPDAESDPDWTARIAAAPIRAGDLSLGLGATIDTRTGVIAGGGVRERCGPDAGGSRGPARSRRRCRPLHRRRARRGG